MSVGEGRGVFSNKETGSADALGINRETHAKHHKGIRAWSSSNLSLLIAKLKCLYTNACSKGNKQGKLKDTVQVESYDLIAIT